jgi:membrane protease YdiL (CAAX protease family)
VYGIQVAVTLVLFGKELLRHASKNNSVAAKLGLGLFGVFTVIGTFVAVAVLLIIVQFSPGVQSFLSRPNPVLNVPPSEAWILIVVSFLVVGPAEEFLFRGFMYGGLLSIFKGKRWLSLAFVSSLMFAAVHGYYAVTYEAASVVAFILLISFGFSMCIAYYWSNGNLLVLAIIHGAYDATGFIGVATTEQFGLYARGALIALGLVCALLYLPKKLRVSYTDQSQPPPPPPPDNEIPASGSSVRLSGQ